MVSITIIVFFFAMWKKSTIENVRLAYDEEIRLANVRLYGTTEPPD